MAVRGASLLALALCAMLGATASAQSVKCVLCGMIYTLMEQPQDGSVPTGANPDVTCQGLGMCDGSCPMFGPTTNSLWPVASPLQPTDGGVIDQRRALRAAPRSRFDSIRSTASKPTALEAADFLRNWQPREGANFHDAMAALLSFFGQHAAKHAPAAAGKAGKHGGAAALPAPRARSLMGPCEDGLNITCDINRVFSDHLPLTDGDGDNFAPPDNGDRFLTNGFRGADWRGRDCNDSDATIYPGRRTNAHGAAVDHNCNGISGGNASIPDFEAAFCSGPNAPMGIAILGDSAAAHFHLPPQMFNARSLSWAGVLELASNEADWPQCSWSTGYRNTSDCPSSHGVPMNSFYQRMRARNLCGHRDLQNSSMAPLPTGIVNALARDKANDAPLLAIHALIGNDVCNGHPGMGSMTTPQEFQANVLATLSYLDTVLPQGSNVMFLGLADGRVLWDTTNTRIHPIGIPYPQLYQFLGCNGASPCLGWMTSNATMRNATSARAAALTATYDTIIAQNSSDFSFGMYRPPVDWFALVNDYVAAGGDAMDIIEPVDGFHPSQTGQQLLAEIIYNFTVAAHPDWLPAVNPYNAEIAALFGDQGGY